VCVSRRNNGRHSTSTPEAINMTKTYLAPLKNVLSGTLPNTDTRSIILKLIKAYLLLESRKVVHRFEEKRRGFL